MNKFVLDIKLKNNFGLEIDILHWDERFLWDANKKDNSLYDFYGVDGFEMFSFNQGYICNGQLCLPERRYFKPNYRLSHNFDNEFERYNYLKKMYTCLNEWGKFWNDILSLNEKIYIDSIVVNGQYWLM